MKYLSIAEFKVIFEEWKSSGLSVHDYCLNTSFTECKFYYWKKKLQEKAKPKANDFIPVQLLRIDSGMTLDILKALINLNQ